MSTVPNPYLADLGDRDPLRSLADTPARIRSLVSSMSASDLERSYAPGKWTARQLLVHLAQTELGLTARARMALSTADYVAQPFDQDKWMELESGLDAETALSAYLSLRRMNLQLFRNLSAEERSKVFRHPEYGELDLAWVIEQIAGHELRHLKQLEAVAAATGA
jgi:hypothetical protein